MQILNEPHKLTLARLDLSSLSLCPFVTQGLLPLVVVLGCGFSCARVWLLRIWIEVLQRSRSKSLPLEKARQN